MKLLCRIIAYEGTVYVYDDHEVFEIYPSGMISCTVPEAAMGGLNPRRLGQFNQCGGSTPDSRVIICRTEHLDKCLGFMLRKTRLERVAFRPHPHHPLHDDRRAKAAKRKAKKGIGDG